VSCDLKEASLFEMILGLPAHPLLVHATVVFVPLLAFGAVVYALAPFLRERTRWVVILLALAGPMTAWLAKLSGDAFRRRQAAKGVGAEMLAKIDQHKSLGDATLWVAIALGVATLLLVAATSGRLPLGRKASASGTADDPAGLASSSAKPPSSSAEPPSSSAKPASGAKVVQTVLIVATVGLAVASGYYVFKTGDSGARMEWTGR
jgi:hypothetical protein